MAETFVGIQIGAISFIDEGVDAVLDRVVETAGVTTLCISALSWSRGNAGRSAGTFPDHGEQVPDALQGGAFFEPDDRFYRSTSLGHFRAPDPLYANFDALGDVISAARKRGIGIYPYYCEIPYATPRPLWVPGFSQVLEVDAFGRKATRPCLRNPNYRAWTFGVIENWLTQYDLDGIMWGIERQGALSAMLDGDVPTCFCTHCRQEAHHRNIDANRAAEGYRALDAFMRGARRGETFPEGYLISFLRLLTAYPEVAQWEKLWVDGHKDLYREISGQVKFYGQQLKVGFGVWQAIDTFNPFLRAQHDPAEYALYADWVKPVLYNLPAGDRFARYLERLCETILRDATADEWAPVFYKVLGLHEAPLDEIGATGFSSAYVREQTERFVNAVGPDVAVYPGIGVGLPRTEQSLLTVTPAAVAEAIEAAFEGGASGIVISRNYSEMMLADLAAVGDTLRRIGKV